MTISLNRREPVSIHVARGMVDSVITRNRLNGVATGYLGTLALEAKGATGQVLFTLGVGNGITLSMFESVAFAQATFLFSQAQTLQVPAGNFASYRITQGAPGSQTLVCFGPLIGQEAR